MKISSFPIKSLSFPKACASLVSQIRIALQFFLVVAIGWVTAQVAAEETAMPVDGLSRLFILSGQSNMVGLNPDDSFTPTLQAAFPNDKIVIVKDAENGQPLRRWFAREEARDLYHRLFEKVKAASTDQPFDSVTFIWMQGEADASWAEDSGRYEAHMKGLIQQLRNDLDNQEMEGVIGRISNHYSDTAHGDKVREVQVKVAENDPLVGWINTDDVERRSDGIHYTKEGHGVLGKRFAEKAIELLAHSPSSAPASDKKVSTPATSSTDDISVGVELTIKSTDWGSVSTPKMVAPGGKAQVQVAFDADAIPSDMVLRIDLHGFVNGKRDTSLGRAAPIKIQPGVTTPYTAELTIPQKPGLTRVIAVIYVSPTGGFGDKILSTGASMDVGAE